jgi:hypothetical protein
LGLPILLPLSTATVGHSYTHSRLDGHAAGFLLVSHNLPRGDYLELTGFELLQCGTELNRCEIMLGELTEQLAMMLSMSTCVGYSLFQDGLILRNNFSPKKEAVFAKLGVSFHSQSNTS